MIVSYHSSAPLTSAADDSSSKARKALPARSAATRETAPPRGSKRSVEEALGESERCYRVLFEHAPDAIVVLDAKLGRFVDANGNALALFGADIETLLQLGPADVSPPTQPDGRTSADALIDHLRVAAEGGSPHFEWQHRSLDGREMTCDVRLVRLPSNGRCLIRGSITDVTATRKLHEEVRRWQRIDALGQVAGGVAHDFNNLLSVILASANFLHEHLEHDEEGRQDVEMIREAALSGSMLTRRLLAFSRREPEQVARIDVNEMLRALDRLLQGMLGGSVSLELVPSAEEAHVLANRSQLEQLLINLALNARDAMPAGGTLRISTAVSGDETSRRVTLRVQDTGIGMSAETMSHCFEPFFTTKEPGEGTGLGLATAFGIVKAAKGTIQVSSVVGEGTVFEVDLPRA